MTYIDIKYINLLSPKLRNFKKKSPKLFNFSCPICGDSQQNKLKARGYLIQKKLKKGLGFVYYCHNCNYSTIFPIFLKELDPELHRQYVLEKYKEKDNNIPNINVDIKSTPIFTEKRNIIKIPFASIDLLPDTNKAVQFVKNRIIPEKFYSEIYYAPSNTISWFNNKYPKILIPFYNSSKELIAIQARSIYKWDKPKYLTHKFVEDAPKVFGLDRLDTSKHIYILEGPIDSMFIPNSIAMAGASLTELQHKYIMPSQTTYIFDNEKRNVEILKSMEKIIDQGFNICIWPENETEKDINDLILKGYKVNKIMSIINDNTYKGLTAKLKLKNWKRR